MASSIWSHHTSTSTSTSSGGSTKIAGKEHVASGSHQLVCTSQTKALSSNLLAALGNFVKLFDFSLFELCDPSFEDADAVTDVCIKSHCQPVSSASQEHLSKALLDRLGEAQEEFLLASLSREASYDDQIENIGDDDDYDPRKPEYIRNTEESAGLHQQQQQIVSQMNRLEAFVRKRRAASLEDAVARHYEAVIREMQIESSATRMALPVLPAVLEDDTDLSHRQLAERSMSQEASTNTTGPGLELQYVALRSCSSLSSSQPQPPISHSSSSSGFFPHLSTKSSKMCLRQRGRSDSSGISTVDSMAARDSPLGAAESHLLHFPSTFPFPFPLLPSGQGFFSSSSSELELEIELELDALEPL
mmetsp:Transcript_47191/g.100995  ORF Transcript_47191/g.100995 Transcript_47191/m.100995 type:complete len:361 (+) Transcript_47191:118-1200(+)|eukprot:CAMPEP_0206465468 /NCGR_PEP_ID=MMETSP0324_2-20121206/27851_1 /ASSEMBLY_ACC=CAM_ASM_000836 /TAXON_ID=2866 /ORGANISM="Crypthecodinium cohnii, Strain Seligo" /LENGTH=360 /DNA_ID=CAMNT_0053938339 /DNA_START=73 /DNA_END=1155 /DNA_ORIENTATION=+